MSQQLSTPAWRAEILAAQPAGSPAPALLPPGQFPREGVWVKIEPDGGAAWFALAAKGMHGWTGLSAHPDPAKVVVVAGGRGWVLNAKGGAGAAPLPAERVWDARCSSADGVLLVCAGDTVIAFDPAGERWRLPPGRLRDPNILGWKRGIVTIIGETGHDCTDTLTLAAATGQPAEPVGGETE